MKKLSILKRLLDAGHISDDEFALLKPSSRPPKPGQMLAAHRSAQASLEASRADTEVIKDLTMAAEALKRWNRQGVRDTPLGITTHSLAADWGVGQTTVRAWLTLKSRPPKTKTEKIMQSCRSVIQRDRELQHLPPLQDV